MFPIYRKDFRLCRYSDEDHTFWHQNSRVLHNHSLFHLSTQTFQPLHPWTTIALFEICKYITWYNWNGSGCFVAPDSHDLIRLDVIENKYQINWTYPLVNHQNLVKLNKKKQIKEVLAFYSSFPTFEMLLAKERVLINLGKVLWTMSCKCDLYTRLKCLDKHFLHFFFELWNIEAKFFQNGKRIPMNSSFFAISSIEISNWWQKFPRNFDTFFNAVALPPFIFLPYAWGKNFNH